MKSESGWQWEVVLYIEYKWIETQLLTHCKFSLVIIRILVPSFMRLVELFHPLHKDGTYGSVFWTDTKKMQNLCGVVTWHDDIFEKCSHNCTILFVSDLCILLSCQNSVYCTEVLCYSWSTYAQNRGVGYTLTDEESRVKNRQNLRGTWQRISKYRTSWLSYLCVCSVDVIKDSWTTSTFDRRAAEFDRKGVRKKNARRCYFPPLIRFERPICDDPARTPAAGRRPEAGR